MKTTPILGLLAAAALAVGCAHTEPPPPSMGGTSDTDHNVLTGGPITGTTVQDLPPAVKNTLMRRAPHGEIADIDRLNREGNIVYRVTFTDPSRYARIFITQEGGIWWESSVEVNDTSRVRGQ